MKKRSGEAPFAIPEKVERFFLGQIIVKIAITSDHAGFDLKTQIIEFLK